MRNGGDPNQVLPGYTAKDHIDYVNSYGDTPEGTGDAPTDEENAAWMGRFEDIITQDYYDSADNMDPPASTRYPTMEPGSDTQLNPGF